MTKKNKSDAVRLVPSGPANGGRKRIPGKWVSISLVTGSVRFSGDLVSSYEWLSNCGRISLVYCKNEISIAPSDDGFKVTKRSFPNGSVQHSILVRAFIGGDLFSDRDLIFLKNSERFEVKTLRKSFIVNLNRRKT